MLVSAAHKNAASVKEKNKMAVQWSMAAFIYTVAVCFASSLLPEFRGIFGDFMRKLVYGKHIVNLLEIV